MDFFQERNPLQRMKRLIEDYEDIELTKKNWEKMPLALAAIIGAALATLSPEERDNFYANLEAFKTIVKNETFEDMADLMEFYESNR